WETDLKYGYIHGEDRFFYKLSYLDVFDRTIVNSHIGLKCEAKDAVFTLKKALAISINILKKLMLPQWYIAGHIK
ncbi:MAG TPA: hypothetical protein VIO64_21750, partial [Pseudobacteroides sp.]